MDDKPLQTNLRYYGISPWEIEVLYGILNDKFTVVQEETGYGEIAHEKPAAPQGWGEDDQNLVSALIITIPVQFSEEFFKWFGFKRWEKIKSIIKEMKRRRGNGKAIRVEFIFVNEEWNKLHGVILSDNADILPDYPHVLFEIDLSENHSFNSAIEKIDFMVELLPYHLNHSEMRKFCKKPKEVRYYYDIQSGKWKLGYVLTFNGGGCPNIDGISG